MKRQFRILLDVLIAAMGLLIFSAYLAKGLEVHAVFISFSLHRYIIPLTVLGTLSILRLWLKPRGRWGFGDIMFLLMPAIVSVYLSSAWMPEPPDTFGARYLPATLLRDGTADLSEFRGHMKFGGAYQIRGRFLSVFPAAPALFGIPVHLTARLFGAGLQPEYFLRQGKATASVITALSAVLLFLILRRFLSWKWTLSLTMFYAFGTSAWSSCSQAPWQHGPVLLCLNASLLFLLRSTDDLNLKLRSIFFSGLFAGAAFACRPTALIGAAVIFICMLFRTRRGKAVLLFLAGAVAPAAFFVSFNLYYFDHILGGYRLNVDMDRWSGSWSKALLGNLFSPNRGLFVFTPMFFFSVAGMIEAFRKRSCFFIMCSVAVILHLAVISKFSHWWGGHSYGPRLNCDILGFLTLLTVPVLRKYRKINLKVILPGALMIASIAVQAIGVYSTASQEWNSYPPIDAFPERLWRWSDMQILAGLQYRPPAFPHRFYAARTYYNTGVYQRDERSSYGIVRKTDTRIHNEGVLSKTPYFHLEKGDYLLKIRVAAEDKISSGPDLELRIVRDPSRKIIFINREITLNREYQHDFQLVEVTFGTQKKGLFSLQIVYNAQSSLTIDYLEIDESSG